MTAWDEALNVRVAEFNALAANHHDLIAANQAANQQALLANHAAMQWRDNYNSQFNASQPGSFIEYGSNTLPRFLPSSGRFVCAECGLSHPDMGQAIICDHSGNVVPIRKLEEALAPPSLRTPEQITADLEARYAELEAEVAKRRHQEAFACKKCAHLVDMNCTNRLVIGFDSPILVWSEATREMTQGKLALCGPEKALWEPRRSLWARFVDWFLAPWRETVPD